MFMLVSVDNPPIDGEGDYPAALAAFRAAWDRLLTAVRATRDPQAHFDRASETGELLSKLVAEDATERGTAAARILDAESLSLTGLGQRISMSKQRAGKLVEKGRKSRGGQ
jgi:hypothetical protein